MRDGNKTIVIEFDGVGVEQLDNESGGHRIQRVPRSEHKGRVHSSTVTVAVMGGVTAAKTIYDQRSENDFSIEWYSGSGAGGQHRNKHQNSARITHIPSGIVRQAQTRKRENSFQEAMGALTAELDRLSGKEAGDAENSLRRSHVGTGERSDKRRTLRFQENIVHDHITGKSAPLNKVMKGEFRLLW